MRGFQDQLVACLPDLWRYAFALTRDRSAADDLVQDCAERALKKRGLWITGQALRPWLTTMLLNIFRNQYRQKGSGRMVPFDAELHSPAVAPAGEARIELNEILERVAWLPEEQRAPLLLVTVAGLSYDEAAKALNVPRGTVMSRLSRARLKLRSPEPGQTRLRTVE